MIRVTDLTIAYPGGAPILESLSFTVSEGESVALIGANGTGKTSLLLALTGILPCSGRIEVDGVVLAPKTLKTVRQKIGFVFQNPDEQLFCSSLRDDIAFGLENLGTSESDVSEQVDKWLQRFGLAEYARRSAQNLSGGEKRMASLASVLCMNPSVVLLDEPTSFLDRRARQKLEGVLQELKQTRIIATHDIPFASRVCQRAILICDGKIEADGACSELFCDDALMERCGADSLPK